MRRSSSQIRLSGLPVPLRVLVGRCRYLRVGYLGRGVLASIGHFNQRGPPHLFHPLKPRHRVQDLVRTGEPG